MTPEEHQQQKIQLAVNILKLGKQLAPDRFPKPNLDIAEQWAFILDEIHVPWEVWPEAVRWWSLNTVGDRMVTPRELKDAAYMVRDRWTTDPEKKRILDRHWMEHLQWKAQQGLIPPSSVPESADDDSQQRALPRSQATTETLEQFLAGVRQRRIEKNRRVSEASRGELFTNANKQPGETWQEETP